MAAGGEKSIAGGSSKSDLKRKGARNVLKASMILLQNYLFFLILALFLTQVQTRLQDQM